MFFLSSFHLSTKVWVWPTRAKETMAESEIERLGATWSYNIVSARLFLTMAQKNKTGTVLRTCQKINTAQDSTLPSCSGSQPWGKDGQRIILSILSILNIRLGSLIWLRTGRTSGLQWRENTKRLQLEHTIESWMHSPLTLPHKSIEQIGSGKIDQYRG